MWRVDRPTISAEEAFEVCVSRIKDVSLKTRMEAIAGAVVTAADEYVEAAATATLHRMMSQDGVDGQVTTLEMMNLYDWRMVKAKSSGRKIYDSLMTAAEYGRCPFCGHRQVSTLDHMLPKTDYPVLAVVPDNLVPACADCNKEKGHGPIEDESEQYLHPYFDAIEEDLWLKADVLEKAPAAVRFNVECPEHWDVLTGERVRRQFDRLKLGRLYTSQAAQELVNIRHQLSMLYERAGASGVKLFLAESHDTRSRARANAWNTAFYAALHESSWYCDGGFA